jgi:LuxR family maltose regulon positive regulatory protein
MGGGQNSGVRSATSNVGSPLLTVKLRAPAVPEHYVRRARLHRLLDEVVSSAVTLVVAPAGAGKTSLLAGWITESSVPVCWLTLDESDRDAMQLWAGVAGALETVTSGCHLHAQAWLGQPGSLFDALDQLLEDLDALVTAPTVLVVDDVHLVDDDEVVAASLASFVRHLPKNLHLVLSSRRMPKLPVDRLRVRGLLGEVRLVELRFSPDEATEMLTRLAPSMPAEQVATTAARADGWAAGLQLAALAARSARALPWPDPPNVETDLLVHDYVWHEVLCQEDPELVRVLSDIAVVDRVDPSLAQALTGRVDTGDLLLGAEARGLFVSRLRPEGWFEVHALIRASLLEELDRRDHDHVVGQHVRAAQWFEAHGEIAQAVDHWLAAGAHRHALGLLSARHGDIYDTGREATLRRTIAAIPLDVATADLEALLDYAWCHLLVSRRRFVELVDQMTWWAVRSSDDERLARRVTILGAIASLVSGRWVSAGALARQGLAAMGDSWQHDPIGRFGWNTAAREIALSESWDESDDRVREVELALSRDPTCHVALDGTRALGEALAGRPIDALRVAAGVRGAVSVESMTVLDAELRTAEALARREIGDRSRAAVELESLAELPAETMLYCRVLACAELVHSRLDDGDLGAAHRLFAELESLVDAESFGADGRQWLARLGTRLALFACDVDSANRWAGQIDDPFWGPVSAARVLVAVGDLAAGAAALEPAEPRCPRHDVVFGLLRAQVADNREDALKATVLAVERAASTGIVQTIASEGPELVQLVERVAWRAPTQWMDRLRRAAIARPFRNPAATPEPLTGRERDVLRFLPSRLTLAEIANELYISPNTLKFHLKVIYRKLGVGSRAEAAEVAKGLGAVRDPYAAPGPGSARRS